MNRIQTLREKFKYLDWNTAWNYFKISPSLWQAMFPKRKWAYLGNSLEKIFSKESLLMLNLLLPARFTDELKEKNYSFHSDHPLLLYFFVRYYQPEIMIETGVARGASSAFILLAMQENNKGKLYSIDLPPQQAAIQKEDFNNGCSFYELKDGQGHWINGNLIGDLVPGWLKNRWSLILGHAELELPKLISRLNQIDIFYHDSLHTESHMQFEFQTAWPVIRAGGFLLSHDVFWNNAFYNFAHEQNIKPIIHRSLGILPKT